MLQLQNDTWTIEINPDKGCWSAFPRQANGIRIQNARIQIQIKTIEKKERILDGPWLPLSGDERQVVSSRHGSLERAHLEFSTLSGRVKADLDFVLPAEGPLFMWRASLRNLDDLPIFVDQIDLLRAGGQSSQGRFILPAGPAARATFYSNGWQSWSRSGTYPASQVMQHSRLGLFQQPMVINPGTPTLRQAGYFTSDFFAAITDFDGAAGLLAGFLSQHHHFGSIEAVLYDQPSLRVWANGDHTRLDPGAEMTTDWAVMMPFDPRDPDPIAPYLEAVALENEVRLPESTPSGWCSWYHFYTKVSAEDIRKNNAALVHHQPRLPLELVQIDDGFEAQIGDWFGFKDTFPGGVAPLAAEIRAAGFTPGLWLAPFIVHPHSKLAREHPEYLLRGPRGRPANAGFVWNTFTQALDLTVPEALDYACRVIAAAAGEWGYPYLKLDFLYAAALKGTYHDPTRTRAQVLRTGMQALRQAAGPDTFLLGCGAPLGSVIGLVEAMRIGADVSGSWQPAFAGVELPFKDEPHMPSARNSIHNILTRAPLHQRWWVNDPDCLLVRPDTNLTLAEVETLASAIALTGGSLLVSDDIPALPSERLRIAQVLVPVIGRRAEVIDLLEQSAPTRLRVDLDGSIGEWHVLARIHWNDTPQAWSFRPADFRLPEGEYWISSFWDGSQVRHTPGTPTPMPPLPPHGTALLAVYPLVEKKALQYAGSNLHVSQGLEVRALHANGSDRRLEIDLGREMDGWFDVLLESPPGKVTLDGEELDWESAGNRHYRVHLPSATRGGIIQF